MIEIGRFNGTLVELDGRRAILTRNQQRLQIQLGQSLSQAIELTDEAS